MLLDSASYSVVPAVFLKIKVVPLQAMEVYGGSGNTTPLFLKLGARRTEGSALHLVRSTCDERFSSDHFRRGGVGSGVSL